MARSNDDNVVHSAELIKITHPNSSIVLKWSAIIYILVIVLIVFAIGRVQYNLTIKKDMHIYFDG